jgi:hypothetical protein
MHHVAVEMTPFAGVDLHGLCAGCLNAVGIVHRLLIAFNHIDGARCSFDGFFQQGGFAATGRTHQVDGKYIFGFQPAAVALCQQVILMKNIAFQSQFALLFMVVMRVMMVMMTMVVIMMIVMVIMFMIVVVIMVMVLTGFSDGYSIFGLATATGYAHNQVIYSIMIDLIFNSLPLLS